jgi:hypothetical protein
LARRRPHESVRAFYRLGKQVLKSDPATGRRTGGSFARLCQQTGRGRNELAKARKFARLYSPAKLRWLCSLGKKRGRPLTKSHACRLVVVSDGKLRDKLARECARRGWSVVRLEHEIQRVQLKREYGGRQMKRPESLDELLAETERLTNRWIRWNSVVTEPGGGSRKHGVSSKQVPRGIWKRQLAITLDMTRLQRQIQRRLDRQIELLRKRSRAKRN